MYTTQPPPFSNYLREAPFFLPEDIDITPLCTFATGSSLRRYFSSIEDTLFFFLEIFASLQVKSWFFPCLQGMISPFYESPLKAYDGYVLAPVAAIFFPSHS